MVEQKEVAAEVVKEEVRTPFAGGVGLGAGAGAGAGDGLGAGLGDGSGDGEGNPAIATSHSFTIL